MSFYNTDDAQIEAFLEMQKRLGFRFFIVGDLKQSIYRFRGATMGAFEKMGCYKNEAWIKYDLTINYRSDSRLLSRYASAFSVMGRNGLLPYDEVTDRLTGVQKNDDIPEDKLIQQYSYTSDDKKKTTYFYDKLFEVIQTETDRIKGEMEHKKLSPAERTVAILVRTNFEVDTIMSQARNRNVPIEVASSSDLFKLPSTLDLCRLTSALCHPYDPTYLFDLIYSANVNVQFDLKSIVGLSNEEKTKVFISCLDMFYTSVMKKTWQELIRDAQNEPILKVLRLIYEGTQPWKAYPQEKQQNYRANYELLFEKFSADNRRSYLTLTSIDRDLHVAIMSGAEANSRNVDIGNDEMRITALTVHKSKGLEYGTVILPFTSKAIDKPFSGRSGVSVTYVDGKVGYYFFENDSYTKETRTVYNNYYDIKDEEKETIMEESRILYVAMTRAIDNFIWFEEKGKDLVKNWAKFLKEM